MTYFKDEMNEINSPDFKLGEYIYMGMAKCNAETVVISVAYKIDYCYKKAIEFESLDNNIIFYKINKVRVGELEQCKEFYINKKQKLKYAN